MPQWREIPFVRFILPFFTGIGLALVFDQPLSGLFFLLLFFTLLFALLAFSKIAFQQRWIFGVLLNIFFLLLGYQLTINHNELRQADHFQQFLQQQNYLLVQVNAPPKVGQRLRLETRVLGIADPAGEWNNCSGQLLLYLAPNAEQAEVKYGDQLLIRSKITPIGPVKNPEAFDFQRYNHLQNIHYQSFTKESDWSIESRHQGSALWHTAYGIRDHFRSVLRKHLPTDQEFGVGAALILGYRQALTDDIQEAYSGTGAMHVLAVSGLHVGFIYMGLAMLLRLVPFRNRWWHILKTVLLIGAVWAFAFITGASPSVLRAATMFSFIILGRGLNRSTNVYNTLALSAFFLLCFNPYLLAEVGFQLSYLAVLGIVTFQHWVYRLWIIDNPVGNYLWVLSSVSIAAQMTTFPISLFYFHQFPLYFWLSGLVVVPAAMFILGGGLLLFFLENFVPVLAVAVGKVLYWIIWLMNALVYLIQQLPAALIEGLWLGVAGLLLLYVLVVVASLAVDRRNGQLTLTALALLAILAGLGAWRSFTALGQKQMVVYHTSRHSLLDMIDGKEVTSFQSEDLQPEAEEFAAQNYRWKLGVKTKKESYPFSTPEVKGKHWRYQSGYLQFYDTRLGIIDKNSVAAKAKKLSLDYILLQNNPEVEAEELAQRYDFHTLIMDASNAPWITGRWSEKCQQLGIDFIDVGNDGACIIKPVRTQSQ